MVRLGEVEGIKKAPVVLQLLLLSAPFPVFILHYRLPLLYIMSRGGFSRGGASRGGAGELNLSLSGSRSFVDDWQLVVVGEVVSPKIGTWVLLTLFSVSVGINNVWLSLTLGH